MRWLRKIAQEAVDIRFAIYRKQIETDLLVYMYGVGSDTVIKKVDELLPTLKVVLNDSLKNEIRAYLFTLTDEAIREALEKSRRAGAAERNRTESAIPLTLRPPVHVPKPPQPPDPLTTGYYWSDSEPHWAFLDQFVRPRSLEYFDDDSQRSWREMRMRQTLEAVVETFKRDGVIEIVRMHPILRLTRMRKKAQLIAYCNELGIVDTSGTKEDLARVLWEADPERVKHETRAADEFQVTEKGLRALAAKLKNPVLLAQIREMDAE